MNSDQSDHSRRLNEILAEYLEAGEKGALPDRDQLLAAHPHLADELQSFFAEHDRMQAAAGSREDATLPPVAAGEEATLPPEGYQEDATLAPASDESNTAQLGIRVRYFGDYELLEEIARGGMGVVYKARQVSLNRIVALKMILAGQLAGEEDVARFKCEAQASAILDHPGIVPIYEIGEHEGLHFFSMGYVAGQSLADCIGDKALAPRRAARICAEVADAVAYAHARGIVHRDLKPSNVLLEGDQPRITDFGLARRLEGGEDLTRTGQILGTPAYMPPEQLTGGDVDNRTDIWSLGVVIYEMLSGRLPFASDYQHALIYQILHEAPRPLTSFRSDVSNALQRVVSRALEKDPNYRFQSAQTLCEELRVASAQKVVVPEREKSIVVLPFEDLSPGKDNEYFSDGLTEDVITDLSKIHSLRVIARSSAMRLKGCQLDAKTIGQDLNVEYLLEGSVLRLSTAPRPRFLRLARSSRSSRGTHRRRSEVRAQDVAVPADRDKVRLLSSAQGGDHLQGPGGVRGSVA